MMGDWTLFSNHGHVLVCLARNNEARLRDVAVDVGITERAVQKIVRELQQADFISISKQGRCNRYDINTRQNLRHALEAQCTVGRLLHLLASEEAKTKAPTRQQAAPQPEATSTEAIAAVEETAAESPAQNVEEPPVRESSAVESTQSAEKKAGRKKAKKKKENGEPSDARQQGSLF